MEARLYRSCEQAGFTRRAFLWSLLAVGFGALYGIRLGGRRKVRRLRATAYIAKVPDYSQGIARTIRSGLLELGLSPSEIKGKRILLKTNLVDVYAGSTHISTHPSVVRGALETFLAHGASRVLVAEGTAHYRDSLFLLEESGLAEVLAQEKVDFVDLNYDQVYTVSNLCGRSRLEKLILPATLQKVDLIISMAKMKTHHWAGVTLSMKNLMGMMPGSFYGWPKNVLHWAGISETILDINATIRPHFAIVDGIVGMEGDGPIMGNPHRAGVVVMGRNFPAVDATCARIMGINPGKVNHLAKSDGWLGTIRESEIQQRGETIASVQTEFALVDEIPAHEGISLKEKVLHRPIQYPGV